MIPILSNLVLKDVLSEDLEASEQRSYVRCEVRFNRIKEMCVKATRGGVPGKYWCHEDQDIRIYILSGNLAGPGMEQGVRLS